MLAGRIKILFPWPQDYQFQEFNGSMLFPEGSIVTIKDKGKWSPSCEEFGSSRIITMSVNSIAKHVVMYITWVVTLKQKHV